MAMGVPKTKREELKSNEIKPHFFTIIVSPSQLLKLRLPKKFVKDHRKHLSNVACLRVPNGVDWLVEVTNCKEGYVWLCKGWKQFAEYYSLAIGYLLVFRYEGNSRFRVLILDATTLEIDYSSNNLHQSGKFRDPEARRTKEDNTSHQLGVSERLLKKANAFVKGSPGFIIRMSKSYFVGGRRSVHVPCHHSKKYMKDDGDDGNVIVVMHGKDERSWKMKYRIEESYPRLLLPCWRKFRSDNGLAMGDVCAFKLVSRTQKAYKVAIFRVKSRSSMKSPES